MPTQPVPQSGIRPVPVRGNQRIRRPANHAITVLVRAYRAVASSSFRPPDSLEATETGMSKLADQ